MADHENISLVFFQCPFQLVLGIHIQMVMICLMIANFPQLQILTDIIMWIALILTVVSLIDYLVKNKDVMKDTK